jgi:hypothetical protein
MYSHIVQSNFLKCEVPECDKSATTCGFLKEGTLSGVVVGPNFKLFVCKEHSMLLKDEQKLER